MLPINMHILLIYIFITHKINPKSNNFYNYGNKLYKASEFNKPVSIKKLVII